jgi:hypothetical protein
MSVYRVTRPFAWEGKLIREGAVLSTDVPAQARIVGEWPWPDFFSAEPEPARTDAQTRPVGRRPKRDWLAEWRLP